MAPSGLRASRRYAWLLAVWWLLVAGATEDVGSIFNEASSGLAGYRLGVYGPFSTGHFGIGLSAYSAKLAWDRNAVINVPTKANFSLELTLRDSASKLEIGTAAYSSFLQQESSSRLIGIVGGLHSYICESTGVLGAIFKLPQVAYGCIAAQLGDKTTYPFLIRMGSSDSSRALAAAATYFGFRRITAIASNEALGLGALRQFEEAAARRGIQLTEVITPYKQGCVQVVANGTRPAFAGTECTTQDAINQMRVYHELLLEAYHQHTARIWGLMCTSLYCDKIIASAWTLPGFGEEGLFGSNFFWLANDPAVNPTTLVSTFPGLAEMMGINFYYSKFNNLGEQAPPIWQTFFEQLSLADLPPELRGWFKQARCSTCTDEELEALLTEEAAVIVRTSAARSAFDAVFAFHLSLNQLLVQRGTDLDFGDGQLVLQELINHTSFDGMTGQVSWSNSDEDWQDLTYGERRGVYDILRLPGEKVLKWDVITDVATLHPTFRSPISFKSGLQELPWDGEPELCGAGSYWGEVPDDDKGREVGAVAALGTHASNANKSLDSITFACLPCPQGRVQPSATLKATSCACAPGYVMAEGDECSPCAPGTFSEDINAAECKVCPRGRASALEGVAECVRCEPGTFAAAPGSHTCEACAPGTTAEMKGATSCLRCALGRYANVSGGAVFCEDCPRGTYTPGPDLGASSCADCPSGLITSAMGARSMESCVCPPGTVHRPDEDLLDAPEGATPCLKCTEGMWCDGVGQRRPKQAAGYNLRLTDLSSEGGGKSTYVVYRCKNDQQCPASEEPGTCAEGRKGIACAGCLAQHYPSGTSHCARCSSTDALPFAIIIGSAVLCLVAVYAHISTDMSRQSFAAISAALALGHIAFAVQILNVFGSITVNWPEPLASILGSLNAFAFDLDAMRIQCLVQQDNPLMNFTMRLLIYPLFAVVLGVATLVMWMRGKADCSFRRYLNACGLVGLFAYIALTMTVLLPFHCTAHPKDGFGGRSLASNPAVLCEASPEYITMVSLGVVGVLAIPVASIAGAAWATWRYPALVACSDGLRALERYRFFFHRFTHECYFYGLVYLLRNLAQPLVPVVFPDSPLVQLLLLLGSFTLSICGVCRLLPWRTKVANVSELTCLLGLLYFAVTSAFLLQISSDTVRKLVTWVVLAIAALAVLLCVAIIIYWLRLKLVPRHPYSVFLCHHKEAAAALARFVKMKMAAHVRGKVFLDSDELEELAMVCEIVRQYTKNLVVLLTKSTLERFWCASEVTTAERNNVPIVLVACTDFVPLDRAGVERLGCMWTEHQKSALLGVGGIDLEMVRDSYEEILRLPRIDFPRFAASKEQESVIEEILIQCRLHIIYRQHSRKGIHAQRGEGEQTPVVVVGSGLVAEVRSACEVLRLLLQARLQTPVALALSGQMGACKAAASADYLLIALSAGLFEDKGFGDMMLGVGCDAEEGRGPEIVTALIDANFTFPVDVSFQALSNEGLRGARLSEVFARTCTILALPFTPGGSEVLITAQAGELCRRLQGILKNTSPATSRMASRASRMLDTSQRVMAQGKGPQAPCAPRLEVHRWLSPTPTPCDSEACHQLGCQKRGSE